MAAATRVRALDAAIDLLGTEGVRALSHARVDARAGLPPGSTSNWFRTRRALLSGLVDAIGERERSDVEPSGLPEVDDVDALVEVLCAMVELQTGPLATRTRARYALWLEVAGDPELLAPLSAQRGEFERWTDHVVTALGITDPVPASRALMAAADGLILHRLTVDPSLELRPAVERAVRAIARP